MLLFRIRVHSSEGVEEVEDWGGLGRAEWSRCRVVEDTTCVLPQAPDTPLIAPPASSSFTSATPVEIELPGSAWL